jgi:drug/metabolite transporter (DMT)-like permease
VSAAYGAVGLLIQPVIAAVLAWILFDEALGILHFIGGILILTGIAITQMRKSRQKEVTLAKTERKM